MSRYWNSKTEAMEPYVAGEQPREGQKVVKLNTNENPYPPSPTVGALLKRFDEERLRLYPDPTCAALRQAFSSFFGVKPEQVFCGNGSDEVLAFAFRAFFESGADAPQLLVPDISYSFYPVYADLFDIPLKKIPLREDFSVAPDDYLKQEGGVAIANPNAPTGMSISVDSIRRILGANPDRIVLIDEAYVCFGGQSCVGLLEEYPNLLIVGTLSKSHSLAGLRLGYALGSEELMEGLARIRDSFNSYPVDTLAQKIAEAALLDRAWFEGNVKKIIATRLRMRSAFLEMGFSVTDSTANFLFVRPEGISAEGLYNKLKNKGILIRYFGKPRITDHVRISVGTDEQTDILLDAVRELCGQKREGDNDE
ncbi:MAG: histidinol-phosphate transaminase [Clostridiales bacterium]|nr:histidinol-phosphate transaminase [Clostridiales bacterium]